MRAQFRFRIRLVLASIFLITCLIFARLYFVQIIHGDEYAQKADRQFAASKSGLFDRGGIYFTGKDDTIISAATLATGFMVSINPQILEDPEAAYTAIAAAASTTLSHDAFLAAAAKQSLVHIASKNLPGKRSMRSLSRECRCCASGGAIIREGRSHLRRSG
jgi:cell division protein FtsI/penicillin-binding protein 2